MRRQITYINQLEQDYCRERFNLSVFERLPHFRCIYILAAMIVLALSPLSAQATDGCKVALCIAGNWKNISQCRPEVEQALYDVARGRDWPTCDMGSGNGAGNAFIDPSACPDQYKSFVQTENGSYWECQFSAVVDIVVNGQPWTRLWWSPSGDSVTQWMPAAQTAFARDPSAMDDRFERDYTAWLAAQPPPITPDTGGGA